MKSKSHLQNVCEYYINQFLFCELYFFDKYIV